VTEILGVSTAVQSSTALIRCDARKGELVLAAAKPKKMQDDRTNSE
jgi:hypothetical protein